MTFRTAICVLVATPALFATDSETGWQVITLRDNSVVRAHVTEVSDGFYLANSPTLGSLKIPTGEVLAIKNEAPAGENAGGGTVFSDGENSTRTEGRQAPANPGMGTLQSMLSSKVQDWASSKEGMNTIIQFSKNSDLKAVMSDPVVMQAIQSGDYHALMNSPAMKKLLENTQTQALIQSVLGQKSSETLQSGTVSGAGTNGR